MKRLILIILIALFMIGAKAVENRFLYPLGHVKGVEANHIQVADSQVLTHNLNQLWVYSTFNAWQPRLEASYLSEYRIEDVNFQTGNRIYLSSHEPANSVSIIDSLNMYGRIYFIDTVIGDNITREGSTLYVADRYRGIDIIDVGGGVSTELMSNFSEKWGIKDFVAQYPYIYALNDFGFVTVDISNQNFPLSIATNYQIPNATKLVKYGEYVYVAAGKEILVLSVRDPDSPVLVTQMPFFNVIQALAVKDNRLFVALGQGGVKILDISVPNRISDINTFYPPAAAIGIALGNDYIYIAMGKDGWMIYEYR
ncbi:MAG: hypothetical protein RBR69_03295 [Candidatus Cloacimonadaceae bacterium]|jgi:hypothetical protein|nr:hypothetical protein [Candidatus Cloacimonadota bacterium]MDY0127142.1 hypothetical protein [Candidatus Cloacimonadaceae bacterium]MCB5255180.1 hypothetical protein [Candidatus Cloacimonadota bacterium]MCK9177653.1 hypothetical protein [Candidatus Cloacimonadota bacterium]MCK9242624.1 hypothetical protein [Candidatus Cloacimonadota bacterium]